MILIQNGQECKWFSLLFRDSDKTTDKNVNGFLCYFMILIQERQECKWFSWLFHDSDTTTTRM